MNTNHHQLIKESIDKVESCENILERISLTCCMPIRSKKMRSTFIGLDNINKLIQGISKDSLSGVIEEVEHCGSQIGKLYVSCCTEKKEPLYQELFKQLNEVHSNIYKIMGISH